MGEQVYFRKTLCPACGRITDAHTSELDGAWRFGPHVRLDTLEACPAERSTWKLTGATHRSGDWIDKWNQQ